MMNFIIYFEDDDNFYMETFYFDRKLELYCSIYEFLVEFMDHFRKKNLHESLFNC